MLKRTGVITVGIGAVVLGILLAQPWAVLYGKGKGKPAKVFTAKFEDVVCENDLSCANFLDDGSGPYTNGEAGVGVYIDNIPFFPRGWKAWTRGFGLDTGGRNSEIGDRQVYLDLAMAEDVEPEPAPLFELMAQDPYHDVKLVIHPVEDGAFEDRKIEGKEMVKLAWMEVGETLQAFIGYADFFDAGVAGDWPDPSCIDDETPLIRISNLGQCFDETSEGPARLQATVERTGEKTWVIRANGQEKDPLEYACLTTTWSILCGKERAILPLTFQIKITMK